MNLDIFKLLRAHDFSNNGLETFYWFTMRVK
jgi:hypothetical protein